jgi:hypothetical protein
MVHLVEYVAEMRLQYCASGRLQNGRNIPLLATCTTSNKSDDVPVPYSTICHPK